ncbi:MAG: serine/threonine protein kinase [Dolichospermum sp. JUN01]|nr:serine/threonine protein kinase [Dolichospermum sp. JUN01]
MIGTIIDGRYHIIQNLGQGGFGTTFLAKDTKRPGNPLCVVKQFTPASTDPATLIILKRLFDEEAVMLETLGKHDQIPQLLAHIEEYQKFYIVQEYIKGNDLSDELISGQKMSEADVIQLLIEILEVLEFVHKYKVIHRDIKPSNLMLRSSTPAAPSKNDQLVLIDFGGAKQLSGSVWRSHSTSTRLYSSGYSPQEQIRGGNIGPSADFYALGRTMIQLITGKYPSELEDGLTGKLQWRNHRQIKLDLADLLDEMVQDDIRLRPAHADIIHKRLLKIASPPLGKGLLKSIGKSVVVLITDFAQFIGNTTLSIIQGICKFLLASLVTIWVMILTSICAGIGTIIGFILAYHTSLGDRWLELVYQLPTLVKNQPYVVKETIVYAFAGLGTGWGLTLSGCFEQKRRFLITALMSLIGYSLGWIACQFITSENLTESLIIWILISLPLLTLGLGLRTHQIAYAVVAGLGTANLIAIFARLGLGLQLFHFTSSPTAFDLFSPLGFFSLVSILVSFSLSISHYLIVPCLRWLGWR